MKTSRQMNGKTRNNRSRNESFHNNLGGTPISDKIREC